MDQLEIIRRVMDVHHANSEADEGDKHLASEGYTLEAIEAALREDFTNSILRMFTEAK